MEELKTLLESVMNEDLLHIVVSAPRSKEAMQKIKIRPVRQKAGLRFQAALWDGKKEFHRNYEPQEIVPDLLTWMSRDFKQMQIDTVDQSAAVLVSKKGKVTIKTRKRSRKREQTDLSHNRKKEYLLPEGTAVPFLVKLGVMTPEGKVVKARYDKFRQINRFLEFVEDICPVLDRGRELKMIDFGCGKSYLTFAIYYYLHEVRGYDLRIIGLDLKEDVIRHCNELAQEFGYKKLQFLTGDIALAKAVAWKAKAILSVPCCQHELNRQIDCEKLRPVLKYGLLKERMAALITDGLRAGLLEDAGYRVQVLEFIDMEHTPKNILLRAVLDENRQKDGKRDETLDACMKFLHVRPTLAGLLQHDE